jgi:branched chain amino acid efflux pump
VSAAPSATPELEGDGDASAPPSRNAELRAGALRVLPLMLGVVPFGTVAGIAAVDAGLTTAQALAISPIVFAGASQVAAVGLYAGGAPLLVVVFTALVINLRFAIYSASLASYLGHLPLRWKAPLAYLLTDQAYVLSAAHYEERALTKPSPFFYLGAALSLWLTWQVSTALGVLVGASLGSGMNLEFAIPLTFLALLIPGVRDRRTLMVGLSSGLVAVVAAPLPAGLGLVAALAVGLTVGVLAGEAPA